MTAAALIRGLYSREVKTLSAVDKLNDVVNDSVDGSGDGSVNGSVDSAGNGAAKDAPAIDNTGEADYAAKVDQVAAKLVAWDGPIVIISHQDPDGDALGSTLGLKRALDALGKTTLLPMDPPRYLQFIAREGELSKPLDALPDGCLLAVLDVEVGPRATGAPLDGCRLYAQHRPSRHQRPHGRPLAGATEPRRHRPHGQGRSGRAGRRLDALSWRRPCLTGILTDTGNFRYGNTNPEVLEAAGDLLAKGVAYTELTDRLQWRHPDYFRMLGKVMSTVAFPLGGLVATAELTQAMRE